MRFPVLTITLDWSHNQMREILHLVDTYLPAELGNAFPVLHPIQYQMVYGEISSLSHLSTKG